MGDCLLRKEPSLMGDWSTCSKNSFHKRGTASRLENIKFRQRNGAAYQCPMEEPCDQSVKVVTDNLRRPKTPKWVPPKSGSGCDYQTNDLLDSFVLSVRKEANYTMKRLPSKKQAILKAAVQDLTNLARQLQLTDDDPRAPIGKYVACPQPMTNQLVKIDECSHATPDIDVDQLSTEYKTLKTK